jgi:hypothetical protein
MDQEAVKSHGDSKPDGRGTRSEGTDLSSRSSGGFTSANFRKGFVSDGKFQSVADKV